MAGNCLGFNYYGPLHQTNTKGKEGNAYEQATRITAAGGSGDDGESHDGDDDGDDDKSL